MKTNSETIYLYCRDKQYFVTPSIDLAFKRSDDQLIFPVQK